MRVRITRRPLFLFGWYVVMGAGPLSQGWAGKAVPGLAPAAKQGGGYIAKAIGARLEGRRAPGAFRYRHQGSLATIGRKAAVADFGWARLSGALAWWLWGAVHVFFLVGARNRMSVAVQWFWAYLTFRRGTRLITGDAPEVARSSDSIAVVVPQRAPGMAVPASVAARR